MTYLHPQETGLSFTVGVTPRSACPHDVRVSVTNPPWGTNPEAVYGLRPVALLEGSDWLSARQKADLVAWAALNIDALVEFWEGRTFYDLDLRKRLRAIGNIRPQNFRLAVVVLRALAPRVKTISWSKGTYHLSFNRRSIPDARLLFVRFTRLGFTGSIATSIAKPASVREQFAIGCEFRCGGKRWRCTDVGTRVITAICLDDHGDPSCFNGPPYAVPETVFDENDHPACEVI